MRLPAIVSKANRVAWAGIVILALGQAVALVAGVAGTRLAFASLDDGALSGLALWLIAGAAILLATLRPGLRVIAEALGQGYTAEIRRALLARAMASTPEEIARRRRGFLMLRLTGDMTALKDGLARSLPPLIQAGALIPAAVGALLMIDARFGLGALALAAVSLAAAGFTAPHLRAAHAALRKDRARLAADMAERLPIAPDLARLGRRDRELSRLRKAARGLQRRAVARLVRVEALRAGPGALGGLVAVLVLWDGAARGLAAGEIAATLAALGLMVQTFVELAAALDRLAGWRIARDKLAAAVFAGAPDAHEPREDRIRLSGRNLAFALASEDGQTIPAELNLAPGARAEVLCRDPDHLLAVLTGRAAGRGVRISLGGVAMDALSPGTLRRSIGLIVPAPVLLKGSVRRNLCLGLQDRPADAALCKRIEAAGLSRMLDSLGGLDGRVGEGGRTLTQSDRLGLGALQSAVQRPAVLVVAVERAAFPADVAAYLGQTPATVLWVSAGAAEGAARPAQG